METTEFDVQATAEGFASDTTDFRAKGPMKYKELNFKLYHARLTVKGVLVDNYGKPIEGAFIHAEVHGKWFDPPMKKQIKKDSLHLLGVRILLICRLERSYLRV